MQTALKTLYDQVDQINAKIELIKKYETIFASVHKGDQHHKVVQQLALKTTTGLITVANNVSKLENIMEVTFQ